jgi:hypothetical protein
MASEQYYARLREIARSNTASAAERRDYPTIGQYSSGHDGDARVSSALAVEREIDCAEEQGLTVAEYRALCAEQDRREALTQARMRSGYYHRQHAEELRRLRRAVGLPDGLLPRAIFTVVNGSIGVIPTPGAKTIFGSFTLDAQGNVVQQ